MAALFYYSFKIAFCLGLIYIFYYLVLRKLTFYNWNRWYLLISSVVCVLIPGIASLSWLESQQVPSLPVVKVMPAWYSFTASVPLKSADLGFYSDFLNLWLPLVFFLGMLFQSCRLGVQFWSLHHLRRSAIRLPDSTVKIYQVNKSIAPFSFGNAIFLNKNLLQPAELEEIINHERVHIKQKHTLDVLWLEFLCLVNWFNPLAWLLRKAVRQNLEFIADRNVLRITFLNKKYYQYLLLKVIGLPDFAVANPFNMSSLKTRIMMMNKKPSSKQELTKFLLILPVMALLLFACRDNADNTLKELTPKIKLFPPLPPLSEAINNNLNWDSFYKANPKVEYINPVFEDNKIVTVGIKLKSGNKEVYYLKSEMAAKLFQKRYGKLPEVTLPPSPPVVTSASAQKQHPEIETADWQGEISSIILFKNGKREEYNFNNPVDRAKAEEKYGKWPDEPILKQ